MATLGFSTKWPQHMDGGDTDFVAKIWKGLEQELNILDYVNFMIDSWYDIREESVRLFPSSLDSFNPKLHTIRHDPKNLWKPGRKIHPVVFNRTKKRFQFAPVLECKSVQKIEIKYNNYSRNIFIDNNHLTMYYQDLNKLSKNEGFNLVDDFFRFFNKDFEGKIIHWTNYKYQFIF